MPDAQRTTPLLDTSDEVLRYVQDRVPDVTVAAPPARLPEGHLNYTWRVRGRERSMIVKYAPPYIADNPEVPLDPGRILVEARCLQALGPEGHLAGVRCRAVRAPRLLDVNEEAHVLLMEDIGDVPTLGRWLREATGGRVQSDAPALGRHLGQFIGRLHRSTHRDPACGRRFDNRSMQETRYEVQYQGVADMLRRGRVADAEALGETAEALGRSLLKPGLCLTMGDLWPPSVLVADEGLRVIDWELAHYGRPLQDVAHGLAHLWMQAHRAPSPAVRSRVHRLRTAFVEAYHEALGETRDELWTDAERRGAAVHFGAEILVRAVGPFQDGSVYAGLSSDHPAVRTAVKTAAKHLRRPDAASLLAT